MKYFKHIKHHFLRYTFIVVAMLFSFNIQAQNARSILDKAAATVGKQGGASANFTLSSNKLGKTSGSIAIKGNKFNARTPQAIVWYDGKTQWSFLKSTNEVNITTPSANQQVSMNPYSFINLYKKGYRLSAKTLTSGYQVRLVAQSKQNPIPEMYVMVNKRNFVPSQVKIKQNGEWITINIINFRAVDQPDHIFSFKQKDAPTAEVIDLR